MAEPSRLAGEPAARWAPAATLLAALVLVGQLAADGYSRSVAVSLVPARVATELGLLAAMALACSLGATLAGPRTPQSRRAAVLLGAALGLALLSLLERIATGAHDPGGVLAVGATGAALVLTAAAAVVTGRSQAAGELVERTAELTVGASLTWLALRGAAGPLGTYDVRAAEAQWLGLLATAGAGVLVGVAVHRHAHVARRAAALVVVAGATLLTWTNGPSRATWLAAAAVVALLRLLPGGRAEAASAAAARAAKRLRAASARPVERRPSAGRARARTWARGAATTARRVLAPVRRTARSVLAPVGPDGPSQQVAATPRDRWWGLAFAAIITVTVAVDVISAVRLGAQPNGDGAKAVVRSFDVGTARTPLLGMPTSFALESTTFAAHHPGPLLFDALAPFVRLLGYRTGAFVGAAFLSWGAWLLAVWAAFRAGGRAAALGALVGGAVVGNVIIRNLAFEPNNIYTPFQPLFAVPLLCWAAATGTRRALPWAVLLSSLAMQAYLAHTVLVLVPLTWAALVVWHDRHRSPENRRSVLAAVAVGLVCWAAPLWEAVSDGGGNVQALTRATFADTGTLGPSGLLRAPAWALQLPLPWSRLNEPFGPDRWTYLGELTWAGPLVLAVAVVVAIVRRADATTAQRRLWVTGGLFLVAGGITASQLRDGPTPAYTVLWLGALSVFVWFVVLMTLGAYALEALRRRQKAPSVLVGQVAFGAVALLVLAGGLRGSTLDQIRGSYGFIDQAGPEVVDAARADTNPDREVFVVALDGSAPQIAAEGLAAQLITDGRSVRVTADNREYYGPDRVAEPGWTGTALLLANGLAPEDPQGELLARVEPEGWSQAAYDRTVAHVADWAREHGPITVSSADPDGVALALARWFPATACDELERQATGEASPAELPDGALARLYVERQIASPQLPSALQDEVDGALLVTPIELWRTEVREPLAVRLPEAAFSPCTPVA